MWTIQQQALLRSEPPSCRVPELRRGHDFGAEQGSRSYCVRELGRGRRRLFQHLADDFSWTVTGSSPVAGTYTSRRDFIEGAIQPIGARLSQPIRPTVETIITEGNTVVVLWDGHAVAKDGLGTTTATTGSCEWSTGLSRRPSPSLIQRRSPTFSSPSAHRQSHDAYRE